MRKKSDSFIFPVKYIDKKAERKMKFYFIYYYYYYF
jgi:hypothetical protein